VNTKVTTSDILVVNIKTNTEMIGISTKTKTNMNPNTKILVRLQ